MPLSSILVTAMLIADLSKAQPRMRSIRKGGSSPYASGAEVNVPASSPAKPVPAGVTDKELYQQAYAAYKAKDFATALAYFKVVAEHGDAAAQAAVGQFYRDGLSVTQDYAEALRWYRKAAAQGAQPDAENTIAICYSRGLGVTADETEAARWHRLAAEHGHAGSQQELGDRYLAGRGVTADQLEATYWLSLAGRQGDRDAVMLATRVERRLTPSQREQLTARLAAKDGKAAPAHSAVVQVAEFKTTCLSNVCLGDDLAKLAALSLTWLPEDKTSSTDPRNLTELRAAFRGLSEPEYKTLAASTRFGAGVPDRYIRSFVPDPVVHLVLTPAATAPLKRAAACGGMPVHGIFKSESGHYTSVILMPEDGKLKVVKVARRFMLGMPAEATDAQRGQVLQKQLNDLVTQVQTSYGGRWNQDRYFVPPVTMSARDQAAVGYFDWSDSEHPLLTFYSASFARFQGQANNAGSPIAWSQVGASYERALANTPQCGLKTSQVKLD